MVVCGKVLPYILRMSSSQLEYVVFVLVEKYREQNSNDILPSWWPKSVEFSHPMVRGEILISEWKTLLMDIIESYYRSSGNSEWLRDLLKKSHLDNENKFVHLIHGDTIIESQTSKLNKLVENKINNDTHLNNKQNTETEKTESKICIKESVLVQLLPKPAVSLYDVIKYGLDPNKETFLRKLDLIKISELVNAVRYKLRQRNSILHNEESASLTYQNKDKNIPQNGFVTKPKITAKKDLITPCYVKLDATGTDSKKITTESKKSSTSNEETTNTATCVSVTTKETKDISPKKSSSNEETTNTAACVSVSTKETKDISPINIILPLVNYQCVEEEDNLVKKSSTTNVPNLKCGVRNNEPPFLILTPVTLNKPVSVKSEKTNNSKENVELKQKNINSEKKKSAEFNTKIKRCSDTTIVDVHPKKVVSKKVPLKKSKTKKNIIKVKWPMNFKKKM